MKIEWTPTARASARRYADQDGMRAIGIAIASLADHPYPPEAFHRGDYHRMRVGHYRVIYVIDGDLITIERVDRACAGIVCKPSGTYSAGIRRKAPPSVRHGL